jgi:hypothetical protein
MTVMDLAASAFLSRSAQYSPAGPPPRMVMFIVAALLEYETYRRVNGGNVGI